MRRPPLAVHPYALPLRRPWRSGNATMTVRRGYLVEADGCFGDAALLPGDTRAALEALRPNLERRGSTGPTRHARAQVELTAVARASGTTLGTAVGRPFGLRPRREVACNAVLGVASKAETVAAARRSVRLGFRTLKVKVGARESEVDRVAAVRSSVASSVAIRVDANGAWDAATARRRLDALASLGIEYVEQPLAPGRLVALARLSSRSPVPVAPDEDVRTPAGARRALALGFPFIILKPMMLGGPDVAAGLLAAALDAGSSPIVTDMVESGVGRAAALHVAALTKDPALAHGLSGGLALARDLVEPPLVPGRGALRVPTSAGLGYAVRLAGGAA